MKKLFAIFLLFFLGLSIAAYADNWNNLTNPNDVPPSNVISDMAKVAIGVTVLGAALLATGLSGTDFSAKFSVTDATYFSSGSIDVAFSGSNGPYTVTGINPSGDAGISNSGYSSTIDNLEPGEYEISFTDNKGNSFSAKVKVGGEDQESGGSANTSDFI